MEGDKELLCIINKSWKSSSCPALWKVGETVHILKKEKDVEKVTSYRPITLTSCVAKLMEQMIKERLQ